METPREDVQTNGNGAAAPIESKLNGNGAEHDAGDDVQAEAGLAPSLIEQAPDTPEEEPKTKLVWTRKRGELDESGARIDDIFWVTDWFVIYEAEGQVRYVLPDDYAVAKKLRRRIADLGGLRASIEELRAQKAISKSEKKRAARELAWALAEAFEDGADQRSETPKEVLTRVDARLRSLVKSGYRSRFVFANLLAFAGIEAFLLILAVVLFLFAAGTLPAVPLYALFGAMGGLGAFLSVMIGVRSIDVNLDLKGWEHVYSGATRIFIGVIGAWVVGLALDSQLIDPTFGSTPAQADGSVIDASILLVPVQPQTAMYLILVFLAGFSESLVPNLLRRGEQAAGADDAQASPDGPIATKMQP